MIIDCCVTKGANLCQQVIVISEGFVCVCLLQDGTQSDNIGVKDLYVSKAYIYACCELADPLIKDN